MDLEKLQKRYAELLIDVGLNLKEGQCLRLSAETVHIPFLKVITKVAYERGARYVYANVQHEGLNRLRVDHSKECYLDYLPSFEEAKIDEMKDEDWTFLRIDGAEDPDVLDGINQHRFSIVRKKLSQTTRPLMNKIVSHHKNWCVAAAPTPQWSRKVLGPDAAGMSDEQVTQELWKILVPILRLDHEDATRAWEASNKVLWERKAKLNDMKIDTLEFKGPGTELRMSLIEGSHWSGGGSKLEDGRPFMPNIPTEEVFTSPHRLSTQGKVQVTRPVAVLGSLVEGAWFEFEDGKVKNYGAKKGEEFLDSYFAIDPRARYLGEVALVDSTSKVFESGVLFHNILYDENAACHIALGSAYPLGFESHSPESLEEHGFNQSILHTDFMIGSPDINVSAKGDGKEVEIIKNGRFVI